MADEDPDVPDVADVDELFVLPPEAFTAARDGLARRLRAEGDRDGAAEVKALRRPTVAAWALNQLVRRHPGDLDALLEAGEALAEAQQEALDGAPGGLREASKARTAAVRRLTGLAEAVLGDRATEAQRRELSDALTAASGDPAIGASLREGRLREPPTAAAGSTFGFGLGSAAPAPARPRARSAAGGKAAKAAAQADAEAEAEAARVAARQAAEADVVASREEAERATSAAAEAREAVAVAEAKVTALATALDQAREEAARAEAAAADAESLVAAAGERARAAEAAAADLDP